MRMNQQQFAMAPLEAVRRHPHNPRRGSVPAIRESISANGWYGAVIAQRSTGYILAGNHRYEAARLEGAEQIPVLWLDVDDEAARRILVADNRTNDLAGYDDDRLKDLLEQVLADDHSLRGTGYTDDDLHRFFNQVEQEPPDLEAASDQTGALESQYQILITCSSEAQQADLLTRLTAEGVQCRALIA